MKNKKLWLVLGGIMLTLVLALTPLMSGCAAPPEEVKPPVEEVKPPEKVFELIYSQVEFEANVCWIAGTWMMDEIEERTNGRVLFPERYHSCSLFSGFDILAGLGRGACDVAAVFGTFNPAELDLICGLGLPLLAGDPWQYCTANTEMVRTHPLLIEEAKRNNIHYLAQDIYCDWQLSTGEKRVTKAEDIAGLTIWAMGPYAPLVNTLGGTPTVIDVPEIYEAAERGLIDGEIFGIAALYSQKLYEVNKYYTEIGLGPFNGTRTTSVNLDTWNSLPPDIQKIFEDVTDECILYFIEQTKELDEWQTRTFREAGMILETIPPEEIQKVRALSPVVIDWWVNIKPEEAAARRQFVQDYLDIIARTPVPAGSYSSAIYFK